MTVVRIEIHAGAGGDEARSWAKMVLRMYLLWTAKNGFRVAPGREIVRAGDDGITSAAFDVAGPGVDRACSETGVHRMVRVSPFDPGCRRRTSFASVSVMPKPIRDGVVQGRHLRAYFWDHQIRSYVLSPYKMAKDLRTGIERVDVEAVLAGDIDGFLDAAAMGLPHGSSPDGPISEAAVMD